VIAKTTNTASTTIDPITFEVIKHRLWQINDEQAIAIKTISASPIVVEGNDFNVGLFTRDGKLITAGFGSLVHVGTMSSAIRSIMNKASVIREGDVFLTNDPFLGALHHNDVVVASPMFWEGEIVLWVGNVLHHPDVGGIDEGSFCINARNLFQEPPRYFLKIVDQGMLVSEVEHTFVTNSRLPDMVSLDLRAQIGAIHVAKERLKDLMKERGCDIVVNVMEQSLLVAEKQIREHFKALPDGSWTGEAYMDGVRVGANQIVKVKLKLTKQGDKLIFDYTGSDPQVDAAVNCTYHATVAGTAVPIYSFLCRGEIDWNDAVINCIDVIAPEGTVVNATFPAPVSICTIGFRWLVTVASTQAVAKMFNDSEGYQGRVCSSWVVSSNCNNIFTVSSTGKRIGALLSDHRAGGAAARSFGDGFSHAGQITSFASNIGNVEGTEWKLPILYLYRKQLKDSGGPGKYRGGLTAASAFIPFGVKELVYKSTNTAGTEQSNASGINGGYPGAGSQVTVIRNSKVKELLKEGNIPYSFEELDGDIDYLPSKADGFLKSDDVYIFYAPGGGGYGDPLDRDPAQVCKDVMFGRVSPERALENYGVIIHEDGQWNETATLELREKLKSDRLDGERVLYDLSVQESKPIKCRSCGYPLMDKNLVNPVIRKYKPLKTAGPWLSLRSNGESKFFELEETICPSCSTLISVNERQI
jgi:N-methylhydantoinase B